MDTLLLPKIDLINMDLLSIQVMAATLRCKINIKIGHLRMCRTQVLSMDRQRMLHTIMRHHLLFLTEMRHLPMCLTQLLPCLNMDLLLIPTPLDHPTITHKVLSNMALRKTMATAMHLNIMAFSLTTSMVHLCKLHILHINSNNLNMDRQLINHTVMHRQ